MSPRLQWGVVKAQLQAHCLEPQRQAQFGGSWYDGRGVCTLVVICAFTHSRECAIWCAYTISCDGDMSCIIPCIQGEAAWQRAHDRSTTRDTHLRALPPNTISRKGDVRGVNNSPPAGSRDVSDTRCSKGPCVTCVCLSTGQVPSMQWQAAAAQAMHGHWLRQHTGTSPYIC